MYSSAAAINQSGQVVGQSQTAAGPGAEQAFLWTATDGMRDLGLPGAIWSTATAINDHGQVVGQSHELHDHARSFLWSAATGRVYLADRGCPLYEAFDINTSGQIVGVGPGPGGIRHALLCNPDGSVRDLGGVDPAESAAHSINDHGLVAGVRLLISGDDVRRSATLWGP